MVTAKIAAPPVGEVARIRSLLPDHGGLTLVSLVAPHPGFLAVQKVGQDRGVMHIRRCRDNRVDQFGFAVHADMRLHAEIPLLAIAGLVHVRITLP